MNRIFFSAYAGLTLSVCLSACVIWPEDDRAENPFLGQWKSTEVSESTVRDSLIRVEFKAYLIERGYDFTNGYPEPPVPQSTTDSFNAIFSCTAPVCDSVLTVYETYLVFSSDTFANVNLRNDEISSLTHSRYTFDADSIYATRYDVVFDTIRWSAPYRFGTNRDTLFLEDYGLPVPYVRNSDPLPD